MQCETHSAYGRCTNTAMFHVSSIDTPVVMNAANVCGSHLDSAVLDRTDNQGTATVRLLEA